MDRIAFRQTRIVDVIALQTRESIEVGGRDARWEFSKTLLFERTNLAARVCSDIRHMVASISGLRQFLGPELKAVTGDITVSLPLPQETTLYR
jgi:hypothetical protein